MSQSTRNEARNKSNRGYDYRGALFLTTTANRTAQCRLGCILRIMNNNIQQPHGKYKDLADYTNKCFSAVRYSIIDMMKQLTNQDDECDKVGLGQPKDAAEENMY